MTHGVAPGGFQSVFTHERHTTSGDTLRSRCEGESSHFARQLASFLVPRGSHLHYRVDDCESYPLLTETRDRTDRIRWTLSWLAANSEANSARRPGPQVVLRER